MENLKKLWKEISVFGVVVVAFICLFAYKNIAYAEINYISTTKVESKIEANDDFTIVVGMLSESDSSSYATTVKKYLNENRSEKIYYVDLSDVDTAVPFVMQTFDTDNISLPQTFVFENGEIVKNKDGNLSYFELATFLGN